MTAPTLPPCPCCGRHADVWELGGNLRDWVCDHGKDGVTAEKLIKRAKLLAAGLRETGAQVHGNYEKWEKENQR